MIIKLLLILSTFTSIITADYVCHNQTMCQWTTSAGSCSWYCNDGCIEISRVQYINSASLDCLNATFTLFEPKYIVSYYNDPNSVYDPVSYIDLIKILNSSDFELKKSNFDININGNGVSCPYGCIEKNKECVPLSTDYICYPEQQLQCPPYCNYNKITNSCTTEHPDAVCEVNIKYKKCPYNCNYNYSDNTCYSNIPNTLCKLDYVTICPFGCILNYYDECVSNDYNYNRICHHIPVPQCPKDCSYDFTNNVCKSNNNDKFCQPYVSIVCNKFGYDYDLSTLPDCNDNIKKNINDICVYNNYGIKFPLTLIEKYKNIKCRNKNSCGSYVTQCYIN